MVAAAFSSALGRNAGAMGMSRGPVRLDWFGDMMIVHRTAPGWHRHSIPTAKQVEMFVQAMGTLNTAYQSTVRRDVGMFSRQGTPVEKRPLSPDSRCIIIVFSLTRALCSRTEGRSELLHCVFLEIHAVIYFLHVSVHISFTYASAGYYLYLVGLLLA